MDLQQTHVPGSNMDNSFMMSLQQKHLPGNNTACFVWKTDQFQHGHSAYLGDSSVNQCVLSTAGRQGMEALKQEVTVSTAGHRQVHALECITTAHDSVSHLTTALLEFVS